jgi:transcriptional regulator with XRE-family HTH domain
MAALSTTKGVERPHTDLGVRIREERLSLGLTQESFAKQLGIHRKTQGNYESGAREPDAAYLAAASKAGVDIGYVLRGERTSLTHQSLLHLVSVIFDALRLTPYKNEFDRVCQLAYEEELAMWRGDGIGEEADRATVAIIKKSPLFLEENVLTDLVERLEFVLESKAVSITPLTKAEIIFRLYQQAKTQGQPIDLQSIAAVIEDRR